VKKALTLRKVSAIAFVGQLALLLMLKLFSLIVFIKLNTIKEKS
jgi:hypothetical protein